MTEDLTLLKGELARMHSAYNDKLDQMELYGRVATAEKVVANLEAECWEIKKGAFKILATLQDAGWFFVREAGQPFGWTPEQVESKALRDWLLPKSAQTPMLESTPDPLGTEGLWHTPSKDIPEKQKLPNYIEHIADALIKDQGMEESRAIATAINAVKRWAQGNLGDGEHHVTPEVMQASRDALQEWADLKDSHHES